MMNGTTISLGRRFKIKYRKRTDQKPNDFIFWTTEQRQIRFIAVPIARADTPTLTVTWRNRSHIAQSLGIVAATFGRMGIRRIAKATRLMCTRFLVMKP